MYKKITSVLAVIALLVGLTVAQANAQTDQTSPSNANTYNGQTTTGTGGTSGSDTTSGTLGATTTTSTTTTGAGTTGTGGTTVTPGAPNTGFGGDVATNIIMLAISAVLAAIGVAYLVRSQRLA